MKLGTMEAAMSNAGLPVVTQEQRAVKIAARREISRLKGQRNKLIAALLKAKRSKKATKGIRADLLACVADLRAVA